MFPPIHKIFAALAGPALFLGVSAKAVAHGSLHDQIAAITAALEKKPADVDLLLLRANAERLHEEWDAATRDIAAAEQAGAGAGALALARVEVAVSRSDWEAAAVELPRLAQELPENAEGWRLAGLVRTKRGQTAEAVSAWRAATVTATPPRPEDFLSLGRALQASGADSEAVAALDAGLQRLGEVAALLEEAARIEEARGAWTAALAYLDRLIAGSPNAARWLARKGEVAERAGRPTEAESARRSALAAIEDLPPPRRNTPATSELEQSLRERLAAAADPNASP